MHDIRISIVYVDAQGVVFNEQLTLPAASTIGQAFGRSALFTTHPNLQLSTLQFGIYSIRKTLQDVLHEHDRIEVYRPLVIDPKDRRRQMVDTKRNPKKWRQNISQTRKL
ncbi:MAG: RnfH family protein [Formosimonas sp.]